MEAQRDAHASTVSPTILIVDDEVSIVRLCTALLEEAGYTVLGADGSPEALKICSEHLGPIDLLLADLVLPPPEFQLASTAKQFPHLNGYDLAVRATTIQKNLRIILMSGNPDRELANHGIKRGTFPFLAKPFQRDNLLAIVQQVLEQPAPTVAVEKSASADDDPEWFG